jgi:hypothetical protein
MALIDQIFDSPESRERRSESALINAYVESGTTIAKVPLQKCSTRLYARCRPGNNQSGGVHIDLLNYPAHNLHRSQKLRDAKERLRGRGTYDRKSHVTQNILRAEETLRFKILLTKLSVAIMDANKRKLLSSYVHGA